MKFSKRGSWLFPCHRDKVTFAQGRSKHLERSTPKGSFAIRRIWDARRDFRGEHEFHIFQQTFALSLCFTRPFVERLRRMRSCLWRTGTSKSLQKRKRKKHGVVSIMGTLTEQMRKLVVSFENLHEFSNLYSLVQRLPLYSILLFTGYSNFEKIPFHTNVRVRLEIVNYYVLWFIKTR